MIQNTFHFIVILITSIIGLVFSIFGFYLYCDVNKNFSHHDKMYGFLIFCIGITMLIIDYLDVYYI